MCVKPPAEIIVRQQRRDLIDTFFSVLEGEITPETDEFRAEFWDRFFDYFSKLQKTEQLRILNQLSDLVEV